MPCPIQHHETVPDPGALARTKLESIGIRLVPASGGRREVVVPAGWAVYRTENVVWAAYTPTGLPDDSGPPDPAALVVIDDKGILRAWLGLTTPYAAIPEV